MSTSPISHANAIERESNRKIAAANERVEDANREANQNIDEVRDKFQKQYENQSIRQEAMLDAQRTKGYEQLRDLQREQQSELRKSRLLGESELSRLQEYYRNSLNNAERDGSEQVRELESTQNRKIEYARKNGNEQELEIKDLNNERLNQLKEDFQNQYQKVSQTHQKEQEAMQSRYSNENQRVQEDLEKKFKTRSSENAAIIQNLENTASKEIRHIRQSTAEKLAAYESRQKDPFYQMLDLHADLEETQDEFILTASIPEHERNHLSATVKGDNLVLSGYRRNEEKLNLGEGHLQGSASFQSFHESFPLNWPVEASRLSREYVDDKVVIRVPKKNEYSQKLDKTNNPKKAQWEHPVFPQNLPQNLPVIQQKSGSTRREPGSGTLT